MSLPNGQTILVGRVITRDLEELSRQNRLLFAIGLAVAFVGLAGGRWLARRAVKPVGDIAGTVRRITGGELGLRINLEDTDDELSRLAADINGAFDALHAALERQRRFTADASHELRTPLAAILGEVEFALARERPPEVYREALESCGRASRRMKLVASSLLALARLDEGAALAAISGCEAHVVVEETLTLILPLARERGVSLVTNLESGAVSMSPANLAKVVGNLVENAVSHNAPGGRAEVTLRRLPDGAMELIVRDDGPGISAEHLPRLFEHFYRVDPARTADGHSGLGLAIVKSALDIHGGAISVTSRPGEGATFVVKLPGANPDERKIS